MSATITLRPTYPSIPHVPIEQNPQLPMSTAIATAFPHLTLVGQMDIETVLIQALADRGVRIERGVELVDATNEIGDVRAVLRSGPDGETVTVGNVAGCDGPESTVRRLAGVDWAGAPYDEEIVIADVGIAEQFEGAHAFVGGHCLLVLLPLGEHAPWRMVATRPARHEAIPFGIPGPAIACLRPSPGERARRRTRRRSSRWLCRLP